jgi:WD40 repeat protein/tRNA A-37 threonylcarbamoyl transferase component Bud32
MPDPASIERTEGRRRLRPQSDADSAAQGPSAPIEPEPALADLPMPTAIGDYEVLEVLGRGGMGVVYKARHRTIGRLAALKMILSAEHASRAELCRFRAEAEAVGQLLHPNIAQIYEVDEADGNPYFALEFVEGGTLSARISEQPLPAREAAKLIEALARAIHVAHQAGILHRDLKPGNILLTVDGVPKIADFGLAKRMDDDAVHNTGTGSILGTPAYMAPEQAEGKNRGLGPGVDIYALGSVLYHMLTGRPPFVGETVLDTLQHVKNDDPIPPGRLRPRVPRDLEIICLKCLQKEPRKRYATANDLADDLAHFLRNEPIRARSIGDLERTWKWVRRQPVFAALLATLVLVIVGGFFVVLRLWLRAEKLRGWALDEMNESMAREQRTTTRLNEAAQDLYVAHMNLAQEALRDADGPRLRTLLDESAPALRGFEWRYLRALSNSPGLELRRHLRDVRAVAFRPDAGQQIATAGGDGLVVLWDAGKSPRILRGHANPVLRVVYSAGGKRLASADKSGAIRIWDVAAEKTTRVRAGAAPTTSLRFGPNAEWLVAGGEDGSIRLWNLTSEFPPTAFPGHPYAITDLAVSPDGKRIASASQDRSVRVWDVTGPSELFACPHDHWATAVTFSADGTTLFSASADKRVRVWDAATGRLRFELHGAGDALRTLTANPAGARLAGVGFDRSVAVWDLSARKLVRSYPADAERIRTVAYDARGRLHTDADLELPADSRVLKTKSPVLALAFGSEGLSLGAAGSDGTLTLWDLQRRKAVEETPIAGGALHAVAFDPARKLWAVGSENGGVVLHQAGQDADIVLRRHLQWVLALAFTPDGHRLLSGAADGTIDLGYDDRAPIAAHSAAVRCLACRGDGRQFASGGDDRLVRLWTAESQVPRTLEHDAAVTALAYHPTQPVLASASVDGKIRVWNADTGQHLMTMNAGPHAVTALAFDRTGGRLVSGDDAGSLKIWNAASGRELLTLVGHTRGITSLAFSPNGQRLASTGWDQTIRLWDAD